MESSWLGRCNKFIVMKLGYCLITQTVFSNGRKQLFFINFGILTRDPNAPNAKTLERVQSRVSVPGFNSHNAVFTANWGSGSYKITPEKSSPAIPFNNTWVAMKFSVWCIKSIGPRLLGARAVLLLLCCFFCPKSIT